MKKLNCDVCRHTVDDPVPNRNYFHICHRDLCEACKDELDLNLKPVIRTQQPFNYAWYTKWMYDSIEKAIQKGKF
jgi:hypothetical protein